LVSGIIIFLARGGLRHRSLRSVAALAGAKP
jgi:hypothetical protein